MYGEQLRFGQAVLGSRIGDKQHLLDIFEGGRETEGERVGRWNKIVSLRVVHSGRSFHGLGEGTCCLLRASRFRLDQMILSHLSLSAGARCVAKQSLHLLCATHTLAPVGALSAQIPTGGGA